MGKSVQMRVRENVCILPGRLLQTISMPQVCDDSIVEVMGQRVTVEIHFRASPLASQSITGYDAPDVNHLQQCQFKWQIKNHMQSLHPCLLVQQC